MAISTHAPRVGGDLEIDILNFIFFVFQPTPPVWGATVTIHNKSSPFIRFQPTPPVWGAT